MTTTTSKRSSMRNTGSDNQRCGDDGNFPFRRRRLSTRVRQAPHRAIGFASEGRVGGALRQSGFGGWPIRYAARLGQDLIRNFCFLASKAYCAYTGKSEPGGNSRASIALFLLKEAGCFSRLRQLRFLFLFKLCSFCLASKRLFLFEKSCPLN